MEGARLKGVLRRLIVGALLLLAGMGLAVPGESGAGGEGGDQGTGGDQGAEGAEGGKEGGGAEGGADPDPEELAAAEDQEGAPEDYSDFYFPGNMALDPKLLAEFKPLLKECNLSQEKAQQLVDCYTGKMVPAWAAKGQAVWQADLDKRAGEIVSDKEIGGEKLTATKEAVNRVTNTFLNAEESRELTEYSARFGDCRAFLKILTRISGVTSAEIITPRHTGKDVSLGDRVFGKS